MTTPHTEKKGAMPPMDEPDFDDFIDDVESHTDENPNSPSTSLNPDDIPEALDNDMPAIHSPSRHSVPGILITNTIKTYLNSYIDPNQYYDPHDITERLIDVVNATIIKTNITEGRDKETAIKPLKRLGFSELALVMTHMYHIINVVPSSKNTDPDLDLLAIYDNDPTSTTYGVYITATTSIRRIARSFTPDLTTMEFKELMSMLTDISPRIARGSNIDLIAVNNGVFDYKTKKFTPYGQLTPEQRESPDYVFLSKTSVRYNPHATNPIITTPDGDTWDVETWIKEIAADDDVAELLWEIIGALVRPYVSWNKSAWFFSERGNNGKGTLLELMRNVCGPQSYASIPLADFGKDFLLEPLTRASAILVDENDVGTFIDKAANLKAIITNDVITINRKHKIPVAYQFFGFMVQCLNEFPRIRDKSESFYRRQIFIPFTTCFTGKERKYIKDDYIARDNVLEYVLKRVLDMNYYDLSEPEITKQVLDEYKEFNDPVRAFWNEHVDDFTWDLLPFTFLYDMYKVWLEKTMPSSKALGRNTFIKDVVTIATLNGEWECDDIRTKVRTGNKMNCSEPLVLEYNLTDWQNPIASASNTAMKSMPITKAQYRGLTRKK